MYQDAYTKRCFQRLKLVAKALANMLKCIGSKRLRVILAMRKPRKIKSSYSDWVEPRCKELMQRYIHDRGPLMWEAWLKAEYEVYRGQ
ncbi:hypothetical protein [Pseudomonas phage PMBT14]|uniref:Uncharacterized protein n=1 Tax=Pseudomonas phage PMBT14 TaxID=2059855 RepID=A0A2S1B6C7_9CAUD|nr:hypothetical protein HWB42_gp53 [Pseudomonas phage PMBT14]AWC67979.1 hypothetical protein [Pseudomonas phage PMBT14]